MQLMIDNGDEVTGITYMMKNITIVQLQTLPKKLTKIAVRIAQRV